MILVKPETTKLSTLYNESVYESVVYNTILSTDAADDVLNEFDTATTYSKGQFVVVGALKRVYRCAATSSTGEFPPANSAVWTNYGATNSYRMFDEIISSTTKFTTALNAAIQANRINTMAFLNLRNVNSVRIIQTDNATGDVMIDETISLTNYGVLSLYDYWYKPVTFKKDLVKTSMHYLPDSRINITFNSDGDGDVGACVVGLADDLGITLYGTSVELTDYSVYETDEYGNTAFSIRGYARTIDGSVIIETNETDVLIDKIADARGSINLLVGDEREDGFSSLTTLGYIKNLKIPIDAPSKIKLPIKIIGVI